MLISIGRLLEQPVDGFANQPRNGEVLLLGYSLKLFVRVLLDSNNNVCLLHVLHGNTRLLARQAAMLSGIASIRDCSMCSTTEAGTFHLPFLALFWATFRTLSSDSRN